MTQAYSVRPEKRDAIPAPTHVDGTGRLQTVTQEANPRYWRLIREFGNLTGVPVVLNTSFNDNEPIVCRPEEAIDCFLRTKMDVLVLGDILVRKPDVRRGAALIRRVTICAAVISFCARFFFLPDASVHILLLNEYFPPDTSATAKCAAQVAEALPKIIASRSWRAARVTIRLNTIRAIFCGAKFAATWRSSASAPRPIRVSRCAAASRII